MFKNTSYNRFSIIALLMLVLSLIVMPTFAQLEPDDPCPSDRVVFDAHDTATGEILSPADCDTVTAGEEVTTSGTIADVPDGFTAWLLVYAPNELYYPQRLDVDLDPVLCEAEADMGNGDGTWDTPSYFGTLGTGGEQFDAVLVIVDDTLNDALMAEWAGGCPNLFDGMTRDDIVAAGEIFELAEITVFTAPVCGFTPGEDVTVPEDTEYSEIWATDVLGAGFSTTVTAYDANPNLFTAGPEVAIDGTLSFSPAEEAFGIAYVTVELYDETGEVCQEEELTITVLPVNDPPVCDEAVGDPDMLWPPNHRMEAISVTGVTDVDSTIFTYAFDEVTSDEPENGLGDGNTAPDIMVTDTTLETGEASQELQVRAERSGLGDGREYTAAFTVDDADFSADLGPFTMDDVIDGGDCSSDFVVFVPHDMRGGLARELNASASEASSDAGSLGLTEAGVGAMTILFDEPADEPSAPGNSGNTPAGK